MTPPFLANRAASVAIAARLLLLSFCLPALYGAGTITQRMDQLAFSVNHAITITATADAADGTYPATGNQAILRRYSSTPVGDLGGNLANTDGYSIISVETIPGSPNPTANWDLTLRDAAGVDILGAGCVNRSASAAELCYPANPHPLFGNVLITITGNSVNSASIVVKVTLVRDTVAKRSGPAGAGSGTVTSVGVTVPAALSVSGSPVTGAGTIALSETAGYANYRGTAAARASQNCTVGDKYFTIDASAGSNWYGCTATNTWTAQGGGGGVAPSAGTVSGTPPNVVLTLAANTPNQIFTVTLASNITPTLATCSTGTPFTVRWVHDATATVYTVTAGAGWGGLVQPYQAANGTSQQSFVCDGSGVAQGFNDFSSSYAGAPQLVSAATGNAITFVDAVQTVPNAQSGTSVPGSCTAPASYTKTDAAAGSNYYLCIGSSFVLQGAAGGGATLDPDGFYMPFGFATVAVNTYAGEALGAVMRYRFVAPYGGAITKVRLYTANAPGSGKGVAVGIMNAAGSAVLAQGAVSNPAAGGVEITLSSTFNMVGGTTYLFVMAIESGSTEIQPLGLASGGAMNNNQVQILYKCGNATTGTGAGLTFPATCGSTTTVNYYPVVSPVFLP